MKIKKVDNSLKAKYERLNECYAQVLGEREVLKEYIKKNCRDVVLDFAYNLEEGDYVLSPIDGRIFKVTGFCGNETAIYCKESDEIIYLKDKNFWGKYVTVLRLEKKIWE